MSEEEKKAIEYIKEFRNEVFEGVGNKSIMAKNIDILLNLIDNQQKEIEEKSTIIFAGAEKVKQLEKEIEELKKENKEIRDWKYVIDNPIDLDKLKELDIIKIKGKEYISKSIYNELEKDKKALVNNYSNVLGEFIPKDKIREKIKNYTEKSKHPLVNSQSRREYTFGLKALKELLEED